MRMHFSSDQAPRCPSMAGVPLRNKAIVKHTGKDRSTINRDLKELRDRGMIETHPEGYYIATKRRALSS